MDLCKVCKGFCYTAKYLQILVLFRIRSFTGETKFLSTGEKRMTLQEKTKITNDLIALYRETNDRKYLDEACEIIEKDVINYVHKNFSRFYQLYDDMVQSIMLSINDKINNGSFDPSKNTYILYYMKDLKNQVYKLLFMYSISFKFSNKDRESLSKYIREQKEINPDFKENDLIANYVKNKYPNLDETKFKRKLAYFNDLYFLITSTTSFDDPIDENGTTRGELIADPKNSLEEIERKDVKDDLFRGLNEMKDAKMLTPLEYDCLYWYIKAVYIDPNVSDAKVAEFMGKSRQNFERAFTSGKKKFSKYMKETRGCVIL